MHYLSVPLLDSNLWSIPVCRTQLNGPAFFVLTEVWCKLGFAVKGVGSLGQLVSKSVDV